MAAVWSCRSAACSPSSMWSEPPVHRMYTITALLAILHLNRILSDARTREFWITYMMAVKSTKSFLVSTLYTHPMKAKRKTNLPHHLGSSWIYFVKGKNGMHIDWLKEPRFDFQPCARTPWAHGAHHKKKTSLLTYNWWDLKFCTQNHKEIYPVLMPNIFAHFSKTVNLGEEGEEPPGLSGSCLEWSFSRLA